MHITMDNDTRGWVMTALSGIACLFGAALICVDLIVRRFPGKKNFRIENSNSFLSASLSLSFGVMIFSALAKMMPSSKKALVDGGLSKKAASFAQIGLFLAGALGIQILSRTMHHFIPSHIVDCDHTHDDSQENEREMESCPDDEETQIQSLKKTQSVISSASKADLDEARNSHAHSEAGSIHGSGNNSTRQHWPALPKVLSTQKVLCNDERQCYGYSDPCGTNCFWKLQSSKDVQSTRPSIARSATTTILSKHKPDERTPLMSDTFHEHHLPASKTLHDHGSTSSASSSHKAKMAHDDHEHDHHDHDHHDHELGASKSHHHHVPTNAFLSIGLQTSLAIALHKLPEGFITYATNHANPQLGVTVFLSLFIHNITEGFALALPLYLALQSRPRAMLWSALLGGLSQPLGAAIAALWFRLAGTGAWAPGEEIYGGMFAVVGGVMANVGMQLMGEAWALGHDRNLCIMFAFIGMGILGFASALTK